MNKTNNKKDVNPNKYDRNKHDYPSKQILEFQEKNDDRYVGSNIQIENKEYVREINKILDNNKILLGDKFEEFRKRYIDLFTCCRDYSIGPGSKNSPTPYGLWIRNKDGQIVNIGEFLHSKKIYNLFSKINGKCKYYSEKGVGYENSPISEVFKLLNDLSKICFYDNPSKKDDFQKNLSKEQKNSILNKYKESFNDKESLNLKRKDLTPILNNIDNDLNIEYKPKDVFLLDCDNNKKWKIAELKNYQIIFKFMKDLEIINKNDNDIWNINNIELANIIFEIINSVRCKKIGEKSKYFKKYFEEAVKDRKINNLNEEQINNLINEIKENNLKSDLSYDAMMDYIKWWIENKNKNKSSDNYFFEDKRLIEFENWFNFNKENKKYIPTNLLDDIIISPTVKRAINETIKIINKILRFYKLNKKSSKYQLGTISVELAKDINNKKQKNSISTKLKNIQNLKQKFQEEKENFNIQSNTKNEKQFLMYRLAEEQGWQDIYTGDEITKYDFFTNSKMFEIEHIIPFSQSGDDSLNNKVLTNIDNNRRKKQLTPYNWISQKRNADEWKNFKSRVENLWKNGYLNKIKKDNLLFEGDPLKNLKFIGRNLSDTRYASKLVFNLLKNFFKNKKIYGDDIKINSIRGKITSLARKKLLIDKDRNFYWHHAIDAAIVCYLCSKKCKEIYKELWSHSIIKNNDINNNLKNINLNFEYDDDVDHKFGELLRQYNVYKSDSEIKFGPKANEVKFSRLLTKKNNISLSHDTIYRLHWNNKNESWNIVVKKDLLENVKKYTIEDIEDSKNKKNSLNKSSDINTIWKVSNENKNILITDKKILDMLKEIYNSEKYQKNNENSSENPFINYMNMEFPDETKEQPELKYIKLKYDNGSEIKIRFLRYLGEKIKIKDIIKLKDQNNKSILMSLNWISIRIYKDNSDKYITIPINQKVLSFNKQTQKLVIDEEKLKNVLKEKKISNTKNFIEINKGTIFKWKKEEKFNLFYLSAIGGENELKLKCLNVENKTFMEDYYNPKNNKKNDEKNDEKNSDTKYLRQRISKIIEDFNICKIDELGNIYKTIDISKKFENK